MTKSTYVHQPFPTRRYLPDGRSTIIKNEDQLAELMIQNPEWRNTPYPKPEPKQPEPNPGDVSHNDLVQTVKCLFEDVTAHRLQIDALTESNNSLIESNNSLIESNNSLTKANTELNDTVSELMADVEALKNHPKVAKLLA